MLYVFIAIGSYLLNAGNAVIDKFLLSDKRIADPEVYAFSIGMLNLAAVVLMPFGFSIVAAPSILLALLAGALFPYALLAYFGALKRSETSRVVPIEGGLVPFFTFILASVFIGEKLSASTIVAIALLIFGSVLISYEKKSGKSRIESILLAILAAFLFALAFTLTKSVFSEIGFINGFIWSRFGSVFGALILLLNRSARVAIFNGLRNTKKQAQGKLFFFGQALGAVGGTAQNYAIALGSVTVVNALQGTQFVFLLILTGLLSAKFPSIYKENFSRKVLVQKIVAVVLISLSIILISLDL